MKTESRSNDLRRRPMCLVQLIYNAVLSDLKGTPGIFVNYQEKKTQISLRVDLDENGTGRPYVPAEIEDVLNQALSVLVVKPEHYMRLVLMEKPINTTGKGRLVGGPNGEPMNLIVRRNRDQIQAAMLVVGENRVATILDVDDDTRKFRLTRVSLESGIYKEQGLINWKYLDAVCDKQQVSGFLTKVFSFVSENEDDRKSFVEMVLAGYHKICGAYQWASVPLYYAAEKSTSDYPEPLKFDIPVQKKKVNDVPSKKTKLVVRKTATLKPVKEEDRHLVLQSA